MHGELAERGFLIIERLIEPTTARFLYHVLLLRQWRGEVKHDDQVPEASSHWGDSTLDALLLSLRPVVEAHSGSSLLPTYSYGRLYSSGHGLAPHEDREAAEVAVSLHLGHHGHPPAPLCFAPNHRVHLSPGDGVVYLGSRLTHWREPFEGERFGQLFLNYVRADGPHRHLVLDGRTADYPPALRP